MVPKVMCFLIYLIMLTSAIKLESVDDTDLIRLLTNEDNVIVLFTKNSCAECEEYEAVVTNVLNELKENLEAIVVKAHESQVVNIYDPSGEPSLIYFRHGIPLLYFEKPSEERIVEYFADNKTPGVKELNDVNFEYLTQSSTGTTTGDWFIFFYSADCILCQKLYAVWEAVAAILKSRLTVARINRLDNGVETAKRFHVTESPQFIFLRQGKIYRYPLKEYTPHSFIDFINKGYLKQKYPETVPPLPSFFDQFITTKIYITNLNNPAKAIIISISVAAMCFIFYLYKKSKSQAVAKKSK